jgi:hypothetical protein
MKKTYTKEQILNAYQIIEGVLSRDASLDETHRSWRNHGIRLALIILETMFELDVKSQKGVTDHDV